MLGKCLTIPNCKTIYDKHRPRSTPFRPRWSNEKKIKCGLFYYYTTYTGLTLIKILLHSPQRKENDTLYALTHSHTYTHTNVLSQGKDIKTHK